jgi:hypothetical protein
MYKSLNRLFSRLFLTHLLYVFARSSTFSKNAYFHKHGTRHPKMTFVEAHLHEARFSRRAVSHDSVRPKQEQSWLCRTLPCGTAQSKNRFSCKQTLRKLPSKFTLAAHVSILKPRLDPLDKRWLYEKLVSASLIRRVTMNQRTEVK